MVGISLRLQDVIVMPLADFIQNFEKSFFVRIEELTAAASAKAKVVVKLPGPIEGD